MKRTPEQDAANEALQAAIDQALQAYSIFPERAVTLDFVVVAEAASVDEEGDYEEEFYGLLFPRGNTRSTLALGLMEQGRELLINGERVDTDDD